jgi:hypothetical protein
MCATLIKLIFGNFAGNRTASGPIFNRLLTDLMSLLADRASLRAKDRDYGPFYLKNLSCTTASYMVNIYLQIYPLYAHVHYLFAIYN